MRISDWSSDVCSSDLWAAQVDGTPGIEYHSSAGAIPYNVVSWKTVGQGRLHLVVSRHGKTDLDATYQLSQDGKTLTYSYDGSSIVYHRWTMIDRSEEHTSELQSLMRISYAVFCLQTKQTQTH